MKEKYRKFKWKDNETSYNIRIKDIPSTSRTGIRLWIEIIKVASFPPENIRIK